MKNLCCTIFLIVGFLLAKAQNLPEFNEKPAYLDSKTGMLLELEKSQYNAMAKAKGLFKAEGGFVLNGTSSSVKLTKQQELKFVARLAPNVDPTSILDLVKFTVRGNQRVFITTTAKATSTSTSFDKISYEVKKIKNEYYFLIVSNLSVGEYFFGTKDFMFAFSIQ
ncbi:hypothetical protein EZ428_12460 [Pedobacter frigiditerrae]|uniref:DUF4251 domain-containing protein n=1 Tax=Pedobacter frigiditerrae TaxID=2530452 RepID=A0A4R0MSW3_9SPHI|nr:hypothetical protein [Pedobacter frigiditerrae]TCC90095.1 hypothetical protein EZ428_12460 [Pedobacter frigiditerrae]